MQSLRFKAKTTMLAGLLGLTTLSTGAVAMAADENVEGNTAKKVDIPVVAGARIFAQFDDKTPAVINYFTSATEQAVINFYQENYGEAIAQERKRGRLTLNYSTIQQQIRVVISQQNNLRQVDVIVDNKTDL